jgi:hypothetical protein
VLDIAEACNHLRLLAAPVNKRYPRSDFRTPGRVHVRLKDEAGRPVHATIHTKQQLLAEVARLVPTLEGRKLRMAHVQAYRKQAEEMRAKGPRAGKMSKKETKAAVKAQVKAAAAQGAAGAGR